MFRRRGKTWVRRIIQGWLLTLWFSVQLCAQETFHLEEVIEALAAFQEEDMAYEEWYEYWYQLYAHPINLNQATREDLVALYHLSDRQINNLLRYRDYYGPFLSLYELQYIPAFDQQTIEQLLPFVEVKENDERRKLPLLQRIRQADQKIFLFRSESTLETKRGYRVSDTTTGTGSAYVGSPLKYYARLKASSRNDFSFGITLEKDAGEKISWHPEAKTYGADFMSGHALLEKKGNLKKLIIGDYQLQFGQGLVLGSGFRMGKGAETVFVIRPKNIGIQPYTSAMETGFFRGGSGTYSIPIGKHVIDFTGFCSHVHQDGNLQSDTATSLPTFATLGTTGFHRTATERQSRKQIREQVTGAHIMWHGPKNNVHAGLSWVQTHYSAYQQPSDPLYNLHNFSGTRHANLGGHLDVHLDQVSLFGEAAVSQQGSLGAVGGMTIYISPQLQLAWLTRHYDPDFHSFYGNAFSENTRNSNENGMYWGIKLKPFQKLAFAAYYDQFRFPWLRYRSEAPSTGYEYLVRMEYPLSQQAMLSLQWREEQKAVNVDSQVQRILPGVKRNLIFNLRQKLSELMSIRTRFQQSQYTLDDHTSRGFAIAQDITLHAGKLKIDGRVALFHTDDYPNRQYMYENDVLYAFSVPAYSGKGVRSYLTLRYKINRHFQCWARIAQTNLEEVNQMGSGGETIEGDTRTDCKVQLLVNW